MNNIEKFIKQLNELSLSKRLKEISKQMEYIKVFDTKGVQGLTGILNFKSSNEKIVFKISFDIDLSCEHEFKILSRINDIKKFCPHFVGTYGMTCIPISNKFISNNCDSDNEDEKIGLFEQDSNYLPTNILFQNYVSDLSYYKILKFGHKNIIHSQILMILCALEISQKTINFTHYDLHLDNILIKTCDENTYNIYIIENKKYIIPTNGYYPVIIDMGNSFVDSLKGNNMTSTIMNYHNGLQPNVYDKINDIHHFLLSTFDYLEYKSPQWYSMSYRIMHEFRNIPLIRGKGWKKLDIDVGKKLHDYISQNIKPTKIFEDYEYNLLDILCNLIELPVENYTEFNTQDFNKALYSFFIEIEKLDIEELVHNFEPLFIIKELVSIFNANINNTNIKNIENQFKMNINFLISKSSYPKNFDFYNTFSCMKIIKNNLPYLINTFIKPNILLINDKYNLTNVKSPIDMFKILKNNLSQRYSFNINTKFNIIDSDKKQNFEIFINNIMSENEIDFLNKMKLSKQENYIFSKI